MNHEYYMKKVFELAKQGIGFASPNPLVGSIIVKDDLIIGAGFHERYGDYHAELNAIISAQQSIEGATLYSNLEPCCHTNKQTPPCAQRIIQEKISRMVIANKDPNPQVNGGGIQLIKQAGIEVIEGMCEQEGELLNEVFFTFQRKKRPFIHVKYAQTLDGNIACSSGDSKWITHENARKKAHEFRLKYDAILIGAGTLVADNPALTIRLVESEKKCPWRIVLGPLGFVQPNHAVVSDEFCHKTILVTDENDLRINAQKAQEFNNRGITILTAENNHGLLNLQQILQQLAALKISSILVEGGSSILTSFMKEQFFDRISVFIAPKIIGTGMSAIHELGIQEMARAITFEDSQYEIIDDVIHFTGKPSNPSIRSLATSTQDVCRSESRMVSAREASVSNHGPLLSEDQLCSPD